MNDIEALFSKAYQLQQNGQLPQAISCYEQVLNILPEHTGALCFLGLAHAQLEDMYNAVLYLSRAVELEPNDPMLHNNLANAYKKTHDLDKAISHYQRALQLNPQYAQAHNNLATVYALQGEFQQALHHYRLAVHAVPDFVAAHYNLGLLLLKNNQLNAAKKQFNNVLTLYPSHVDAQFYIGILQLEANEIEKAKHTFETILLIDNEHVQALTNLGVIALKHEQAQLAIDYFTKALAFDNENRDARNNIAATFMHHDRFENALMHYEILLEDDPKNIEYLYNAGVAQMALGHLQKASKHFETILKLQDNHFAALNNLAAIELRLGHRDKAILLLEHAVAANRNDEASQFMLNALTGREKQPQASTTYISNLFNNYALYYDQHMQGTLAYALPHLIGRTLHALHCLHVKNTMDVGCGTGLCGVVLREISERLIGIDISAKMLAQAQHKAIYDELIESEAITYLRQTKESYDLVVAADVLPYFGELDLLFAQVQDHLNQEGLFIFSHEISKEEPWQLQDNARFCHHPNYIKTLCKQHQLEMVHEEKVIARRQHHEALPVMLYAVKKSA